jgi:adenylate cyclase
MLDEVRGLNERWTARGLPAIRIGIGIHTWPASVGNFGSERRFSYTAVGDTVNLASRLEGLNKTYGTQLLVSEDTRREMGPGLSCRGVGEVTVRGRVGSTGIYELTGRASS